MTDATLFARFAAAAVSDGVRILDVRSDDRRDAVRYARRVTVDGVPYEGTFAVIRKHHGTTGTTALGGGALRMSTAGRASGRGYVAHATGIPLTVLEELLGWGPDLYLAFDHPDGVWGLVYGTVPHVHDWPRTSGRDGTRLWDRADLYRWPDPPAVPFA